MSGRKIGLALSGGGFRATAFHGGVLRQLHMMGVVPDVVAGVSGGAIAAALYASHHPNPKAALERIENTIRDGIRGQLLRDVKTLFNAACYRNLPRAWRIWFVRQPPYIDAYRAIFDNKRMIDTPATPALIICATRENPSKAWMFTRDAMGEYPPSFPIESTELGSAVAVSAALPPFLPPWRPAHMGQDAPVLADGGLWSNFGIQHLIDAGCTDIILSDASAAPDWTGKGQSFIEKIIRKILVGGLLETALQSTAAAEMKILKLWKAGAPERKYTVISLNRCCFDGVPPVIVRRLVKVRSDLDRFSEQEYKWLEYHGFTLAADRLTRPEKGVLAGHPVPDFDPELFTGTRINCILEELAESHFNLTVDRTLSKIKRRALTRMNTLLIVNGPLCDATQRHDDWRIDYAKVFEWAEEGGACEVRALMFATRTKASQEQHAENLRFRAAMQRIGYEVEAAEDADVEIVSRVLIEAPAYDRIVLLGYRRSYQSALRHVAAQGKKEVWVVANVRDSGEGPGVRYINLTFLQEKWGLPRPV